MAGTFKSDHEVTFTDVMLPELTTNTLPTMNARIFNANCRYDIIIGREELKYFKLIMDFDTETMYNRREKKGIPFREYRHCTHAP